MNEALVKDNVMLRDLPYRKICCEQDSHRSVLGCERFDGGLSDDIAMDEIKVRERKR